MAAIGFGSHPRLSRRYAFSLSSMRIMPSAASFSPAAFTSKNTSTASVACNPELLRSFCRRFTNSRALPESSKPWSTTMSMITITSPSPVAASISSAVTPSGSANSFFTRMSSGPSVTSPTANAPVRWKSCTSATDMPLTALPTAPIALPSLLPSAAKLGSALMVAYLSGSKHVSISSTFSSSTTYARSSPCRSDRKSASSCATTSRLKGVLRGLLLRSRITRPVSITACMRATDFSTRSSRASALGCGNDVKCTEGSESPPSGRHRFRFWYMFSAKNGVNGAMVLHSTSRTSYSAASALRVSSSPFFPFSRERL
mmetsp:Transcript_9391/g.39864  ORF Transcript_9391/g.39864 Transcript_9391/m.39864 type:complete len:315 (+) Transcript_9391:123-1067(+)